MYVKLIQIYEHIVSIRLMDQPALLKHKMNITDIKWSSCRNFIAVASRVSRCRIHALVMKYYYEGAVLSEKRSNKFLVIIFDIEDVGSLKVYVIICSSLRSTIYMRCICDWKLAHDIYV